SASRSASDAAAYHSIGVSCPIPATERLASDPVRATGSGTGHHDSLGPQGSFAAGRNRSAELREGPDIPGGLTPNQMLRSIERLAARQQRLDPCERLLDRAQIIDLEKQESAARQCRHRGNVGSRALDGLIHDLNAVTLEDDEPQSPLVR